MMGEPRQSRAHRTSRSKILPVLLVVSLGAMISAVTTASADRCISFTYDGTGNRAAMRTVAATPTWGSAIWGCLFWTP